MIFLVSGVKTIKLEIPRHTKTVYGAVKQATKTCNFLFCNIAAKRVE